MDDFAFPDEENLLKMQKEYEKVLGGKNSYESIKRYEDKVYDKKVDLNSTNISSRSFL